MVTSPLMTADEFKAWMRVNGFTAVALADALEVDLRTVYRWRSGEIPVSRVLELALERIAR